VKPLNARIPAMIAANDIHNGRVFLAIAKRRTTTLIRVVFSVANLNGIALTCIGHTLRSGILMSIPTRF
jgi:hypothetical protein